MARTAKDAEQMAMTPVVYPIYLDVPMMVSFLAALRDGVEFENTVTRRDQRSTNREREASGKVRLPPLASLFGLEASGKMAGQAGEETSEEVKVVRQHTPHLCSIRFSQRCARMGYSRRSVARPT
jgi:hypothetical protein